ncbi:MAG: hypothetical protein J5803_05750 [Desulfovibrio sp.]|nr:hypothetical protein [Desulfovibrio sp.]
MGILDAMRDGAVTSVLNNLRSFLSENYLAGIGELTDLRYSNKTLLMRIRLYGLEDREIEASCTDIRIANDGSSLALASFSSNMPFMETMLNRYLANATLSLPEGNARMLAVAAKKVLGV